ncbi:MAG: sodium ion-translocating decarboxylase subunit beta [Candidatus Ornithospirochaeta sp.]
MTQDTIKDLLMIALGVLSIYLGIRHKMEPVLLVTMGFGTILANIPRSDSAILNWLYAVGISGHEVFPLLLFIGIGAMIDFGPLLEKPWLALLGAAGQAGVFIVLFIASFFFPINDAAAISIIGAADGPTAILVADKLASNYAPQIIVASYSYMALVPLVQPLVMKAMTTRKERTIPMPYSPKTISRRKRIMFPIVVTIVASFFFPQGRDLVGMLMFGNLIRECGVLDNLSKAAQDTLVPLISLFLGLSISPMMKGSIMLTQKTLVVLALGLLAFVLDIAMGICAAKVINLFRPEGKKINPLIGGAGISAFPMSARIVQKMGNKEDKFLHLLPYSLGANVAGQIGSVAAGALMLSLFAS